MVSGISGDQTEAQDGGLSLEFINIYRIHKTKGTEEITKRVSRDTKDNMHVQELRGKATNKEDSSDL